MIEATNKTKDYQRMVYTLRYLKEEKKEHERALP